MKTIFNIGAAVVLSLALSGCITVKCPDGTNALNDRGNKIYALPDEVARLPESTYKNCPKTDPDPTQNVRLTPPTNNPPPGPTPTNLAPVVGGVAVAGAALGLGGNDGNPATATTGTN